MTIDPVQEEIINNAMRVLWVLLEHVGGSFSVPEAYGPDMGNIEVSWDDDGTVTASLGHPSVPVTRLQ